MPICCDGAKERSQVRNTVTKVTTPNMKIFILTHQRLGALALCGLALGAANSSHAAPVGWKSSDFAKWTSPVAPDAIVIEGKTDILWKPQSFAFKTGATMRYIDFDGGSDSNDGASKTSAWKHHPWDKDATGKAAAMKGVATYVFKGGTIYRGALVGKESGTATEPIRLTRDPSWGTGVATIAGSEAIGGWTKLTPAQAKLAGVPDEAGGHIWAADVAGGFVPRATWLLGADGTRERMTLARWPNWKITDPYNHFTQWFRVEKIEKGFPRTTIFAPKVLNDPDPNAFKGATVWVDHPVTSAEFTIMGPFPSSIGKYDPAKGSIEPELNHPVRHPAVNSPFFLENLPRFLDEAGEWYYDSKSRRMLVWMKGDADPNQSTIEVARHENIVDLVGVQNVEISGLRLTGGNALDLNMAPDVGGYDRPMGNTQMLAIRMSGNCQNITIRNNEITDTAGAGIGNYITDKADVLRGIRIWDNRLADLDNDAIALNRGAMWRKAESNPKARLTELEIYRNSITDVGFRNSIEQGGRGIDLMGPEVADIAGNVIARVAAQGININGGRPLGGMMGTGAPDTPLVRIQVRSNKVEEGVMYKSDFGNIEFWATGPVYIYDNLSITPVGIVPNNGRFHKNHAFYFDHGLKGYLFNNIGWSARREDAALGVVGDNFSQEIRNRWNMVFQNTAYDFRRFASHESRHGDQQFYLGNLAINMRNSFLSFSRLKEAEGIGYAGNVFAGEHEFFFRRFRGEQFEGIEGMRDFLKDQNNYVAKEIGVTTDDSPVVNAEKYDFRPTNTSAAIDRGTKVFVPWSLYGNVGEWYFRHEPKNPNTVLAHDLYPQDFYSDGDMLHLGGPMPANDLKGEGFGAADYSEGALENWNQGAVRFDGTKTFRLANAKLTQDFQIGKSKKTIVGKNRKTVRMEANNFIVESVFRAEPNAKGGFIAAKLSADAGYGLGLDSNGNLQMLLRLGGKDWVQKSTASVADGAWHHVLAEVDRASGVVTIYLDGKVATTGAVAGLATTASLDNESDFIVGEGFRGQLDFLRVNRGTLADSLTNINELMSWQFNGPASHDFAGRPAFGNARDSGALENTTARGLQTVNYKPRTTGAAPTTIAATADDEFKKGADRNVKSLEWGAVSVPKTVKAGDTIDVQVGLVTETVERTGFFLNVDLHGYVNGKRVTGLGQSAKIALTPGKTSPYTVSLKVPQREGLSKVVAVVYISTAGTFATKTIATEVVSDVK